MTPSQAPLEAERIFWCSLHLPVSHVRGGSLKPRGRRGSSEDTQAGLLREDALTTCMHEDHCLWSQCPRDCVHGALLLPGGCQSGVSCSGEHRGRRGQALTYNRGCRRSDRCSPAVPSRGLLFLGQQPLQDAFLLWRVVIDVLEAPSPVT